MKTIKMDVKIYDFEELEKGVQQKLINDYIYLENEIRWSEMPNLIGKELKSKYNLDVYGDIFVNEYDEIVFKTELFNLNNLFKEFASKNIFHKYLLDNFKMEDLELLNNNLFTFRVISRYTHSEIECEYWLFDEYIDEYERIELLKEKMEDKLNNELKRIINEFKIIIDNFLKIDESEMMAYLKEKTYFKNGYEYL